MSESPTCAYSLPQSITDVVEYYQRRQIGGNHSVVRDLRDALERNCSVFEATPSQHAGVSSKVVARTKSLFEADAYQSCSSYCLDILAEEGDASVLTVSQYFDILHYVTLSFVELREIGRARKFLEFQQRLTAQCALSDRFLGDVLALRCVLDECAIAEATGDWSGVSSGLNNLQVGICKYKGCPSFDAWSVQFASVQLAEERQKKEENRRREEEGGAQTACRACEAKHAAQDQGRYYEGVRRSLTSISDMIEIGVDDVHRARADLLYSYAIRMNAIATMQRVFGCIRCWNRHIIRGASPATHTRPALTACMTHLHENLHRVRQHTKAPGVLGDANLCSALHHELIEVALLCLEVDILLGTRAKVVLPSSTYHLEVLASALKHGHELRPLFVLSAQRRLAACLAALAYEQQKQQQPRTSGTLQERRDAAPRERCSAFAAEANTVLRFLADELRAHAKKEGGHECVQLLAETLLLQSQLLMRVWRFKEALHILQEGLIGLPRTPVSWKGCRHVQEREGGTDRLRVWITLLAADCFTRCGQAYTAAHMLHDLVREREVHGGHSFPWRSLCLCGLASAEFLLGLPYQAEHRYREALRDDDCSEVEWCCARSNLAALLLSRGCCDEAVALLRSITSFFRQDPHDIIGGSIEAAWATVQLSEALHVSRCFAESIHHAETSMSIVWSLLTGTHSCDTARSHGAMWLQCDDPAFTQHPLVRRAAKTRAASQRELSTEHRQRVL